MAKKYRAILLCSVATREIKEFRTLKLCAEFMQVPVSRVFFILNHRVKFLIHNGYMLKYSNDRTEWPVQGAILPARRSFRLKRIVLESLLTGTITEYDSINHAANALGCISSTLSYRLRKKPDHPYLGYRIRYGDPFLRHTQLRK